MKLEPCLLILPSKCFSWSKAFNPATSINHLGWLLNLPMADPTIVSDFYLDDNNHFLIENFISLFAKAAQQLTGNVFVCVFVHTHNP